MNFKLVFVLMLVGAMHNLSNAQSPPEVSEITELDVTSINDFRADKISIFGVKLGMSMNKSLDTLIRNKDITIEKDESDSNRYYVYDKTEDGAKGNCILYLIWNKNEPGLKRITIYTKFSKYLIGKTKHLLTYDVLNRRSKITKTFLHSPHRSEITMEIHTIKLKETTYYYHDKWIEVSCRVEDNFYKFIRISFVEM